VLEGPDASRRACAGDQGQYLEVLAPDDDHPLIVLTETKFSIRYIPVWARYSLLREDCTVRALPWWSPTRVLDKSMVPRATAAIPRCATTAPRHCRSHSCALDARPPPTAPRTAR
jgi:hypothetical protein